MKGRGKGGDDSGQFLIDWSVPTLPAAIERKPEPAAGSGPDAGAALAQRLKWDFRTSFPLPTAEAVDAGVISDEDGEPENVRSIHEEHAREALAVLHDLDAVLDARRRFVDPKTGKAPGTPASRERLTKLLETEPARLEGWFQTLMDTYEEVFGAEAADAFAKAIRAWHARIEVLADEQRPAPPIKPPPPALAAMETSGAECGPAPIAASAPRPTRHRIVARLPVPKPLPSAVTAGNFGRDENGKPIRPGAHEVREITERHAEKLIDLLDGLRQVETWLSAPVCSDPARLYHERDALCRRVQSAVAAYAEDFGQRAADQLDAYAKRQAGLDVGSRRDR